MQAKFLTISFLVSIAAFFSTVVWAIDINDESVMAYYGFEEGKGEKEIKQVMDGELSGHGAAVFPSGKLAITWGDIK